MASVFVSKLHENTFLTHFYNGPNQFNCNEIQFEQIKKVVSKKVVSMRLDITTDDD